MKAQQLNQYLPVAYALAVALLLNVASSSFFARIDLTEDQRYSISPSTKETLRNLPESVFIRVYLEGAEGDLPAGFVRLKKAVKETLDEFRIHAGNRLNYVFINPNAESDPEKRNETYRRLVDEGLTPTNLFARENGKNTEKIIFPGAVVSYGDRKVATILLKGNQAAPAEVRLNQSMEGLEFELIKAIAAVTQPRKKRIAIVEGHGELDKAHLYDFATALKEYYEVVPVTLAQRFDLKGFDAAIVAGPDSAFSEADKYKLDQFVVQGGSVLFSLDKFTITLDSIEPAGSILLAKDLNLDDLLFKYGARVNADLVLDYYSAAIPMVTGYVGSQPQTALVQWPYYPIANSFGNHPLVRNQDALYFQFAASIDTVAAAGIRKVPLIFSSRYSRLHTSPVRMSFNEARTRLEPEQYRAGSKMLGLMLEGAFESLYTNRVSQRTIDSIGFVQRGKPGKVLIISDGHFLRNEVNLAKRSTYPMGLDRFGGKQFANKDFALNAVGYLLEGDRYVASKSKTITLRPLDKARTKAESSRWQFINIGLPLAFLSIFGIAYQLWRRRSYSQPRS